MRSLALVLTAPLLALCAATPAARAGAPTDTTPSPIRTAGGDERCAPASGDAAALLARALDETGISRLDGRVVRLRAAEAEVNDFQSDRPYAPFFSTMTAYESWLDPAAGVERSRGRLTYVGQGPMAPIEVLAGARATYVMRDTTLLPLPAYHVRTHRSRPMVAWSVLRDWADAGDARVAGRCTYRDFPRLVLSRGSGAGEERLWLDPESGLPVKLDRREPHYLWGDVRVEYVWSTWMEQDGAMMPMTSFRVVDGETIVTRTVGDLALLPRDSAPRLALPADAPSMTAAADPFLQATPTDTVRVGPQAYLLVNRAYTSAVVLARDTVWVLDATQGVERARQDSVWVGKLFPGRHPVAVVVTDLAWPHVAGVRYWVGVGATVVSHAASEPFLRRVVERRWTLEPDLLERRRAQAPFRFRAVTDSLTLGGGAVRLHTIGGIGSEGALMVWLPESRFLYAGDFVQGVRAPSAYTTEVVRAVRRVGIAPATVAAMHLPVTPWATVAALAPLATRGGTGH
jgi:glyoxylase-like metal-dependent hydrolase (beta-lactamase superfamily II)